MDALYSSTSEVDCTALFFMDLNGRWMTRSVTKHKTNDVFDRGVGSDGLWIAGFVNLAHNDRILMPHPPPSRHFTS